MPRTDPYRNFNFVVEIGNLQQFGFSDCSGFGATVDPIEYREGDPRAEPMTMRKLSGMTKYPNITLKWGITDSREMYDWFRRVSDGVVERKDGSVVLYDLDGTEKVRWNFVNGWPAKWDGPDFTAKGNEVAIETLEIAHEGIFRS
jgi:phage tail-like protein